MLPKKIIFLLILFLIKNTCYGLTFDENLKLIISLDKSYSSVYGIPKFITLSKYIGEKDSIVELAKSYLINNRYSFEITKSNDTKYLLIEDDKSTIITEIYVADEDNITTTVFNNNYFIGQKNIEYAKYPGNNCIYANLYPDIVKYDKLIRETSKIFLNEIQIREYVGKVFEAPIKKRLKFEADENPVSKTFFDNVLRPQIELLKIYFENNLRIKQAIQPYNTETIFDLLKDLNPDWWNGKYLMNNHLQGAITKYLEKHTFNNFSNYYYSVFNVFKPSSEKLKATVLFYSLVAYSQRQTEFNKIDLSFIDSLVQQKALETSLVQKIIPQVAPVVNLSNEYLSLLTLFDSAGKEISLLQVFADTSKFYFVDFWASWCRPCIDHLPESIRLGSINNPLLRVLFFNMDQTQTAYRESVRKYKVPAVNCLRVNQEEGNLLRLQVIKSSPSIPAYRLFYFSSGIWHSKAVSGADDPLLHKFSLKIPS